MSKLRRRARSIASTTVLCAISALIMLMLNPERAQAGTYLADVTSTAGPGWSQISVGGPYSLEPSAVRAGAGNYLAGAGGRWRFTPPSPALAIIGGRIKGTANTPAGALVAQVRSGRSDGSDAYLFSDVDATAFDVAIPPTTNWIDVGLGATYTAGISTSQGRVQVTQAEILLLDVAPPSGAIVVPDISGPGCSPITLSGADVGGGLKSLFLQVDETAADVGWWPMIMTSGAFPGPASTSLTYCIPAQHRRHGTVHARLTVTDVSGSTATRSVVLRSDLQGPVVTGLPTQHEVIEAESVARGIGAQDLDSGVAALTLAVDGSLAQGSAMGGLGSASLARLAVGAHSLRLVATDSVGNQTALERSITVVDSQPPTLDLISTGGGNSTREAQAEASATDTASGVDPDSWTISINGATRRTSGTERSAIAQLGRLTQGTHRVQMSVADRSGNRATREISVTVTDAASTARSIGSQLTLTGLPRGPVIVGSKIQLSAIAHDQAMALSGHRITVTNLRGAELARDVTDVDGKADLKFFVRGPGVVNVQLGGVTRQQISLNVMPGLKIVMSQRAVRVGQRVRVRGSVTGRVKYVRIQSRISGTWVTIKDKVRVGRNGSFSSAVAGAAAGRYAVRAQSTAANGWSVGTSNTATLAVTTSPRVH